MLKITIPEIKVLDDETNEIHHLKEQTICFEHSLVSLSKWESKWCKPFLTNQPKTLEETTDYIRCMTLTQNVDPDVYTYMPDSIRRQIFKYAEDSHTATTFAEDKLEHSGPRRRETITSELIYYWMIQCGIPAEYQKWHLSRLLALIRICQIKSQKPKKLGRNELMSRNAALNAQRRAKLHTKG